MLNLGVVVAALQTFTAGRLEVTVYRAPQLHGKVAWVDGGKRVSSLVWQDDDGYFHTEEPLWGHLRRMGVCIRRAALNDDTLWVHLDGRYRVAVPFTQTPTVPDVQ